MRLAAGLYPDPLGKLEHFPRSTFRNWECLLLKREGSGKRKEGGERGRRGKMTCIPHYF